MSRMPFTQQIESAFEEAVGVRGANRSRYDALCAALQQAAPRLLSEPPCEARPMLAAASRTDDLAQIEEIATQWANHYTDLVVVGMGGSSLAAETLSYLRQEGGITLHYADNIDPLTMARMMAALPWPRTGFLLISKSGGTVETLALAGIFLREASARIKSGYAKHFTAITIPNDNPLHRLAQSHGVQVLPHDADICGRFSILTNVGLLPAAAVGVDIRALRQGAEMALATNCSDSLADAGRAAALQVALMEKGARTHVFMHYADSLSGLAVWHRQCWAESLGKSGYGSTPVPSRGATDQHSQLQLYLEGPADKYFTSLIINTAGQGASITIDTDDARLDYLRGHSLGDLSMAEQRATNATLVANGCPLRSITLEAIDATRMGALLMHFMLEIMFVSHLLGINAYDQPAVEASKRLALDYLSGKES